MTYFVTGATGFIGKYLVEQLLRREGTVYVLIRPQSMGKFEAMKGIWAPTQIASWPLPGIWARARSESCPRSSIS